MNLITPSSAEVKNEWIYTLLWCAQRRFAFIKVIAFYMQSWIKIAHMLSGVRVSC